MNNLLPVCCGLQAFKRLCHVASMIESPDALLQGAVAIAMHQAPDVKPDRIDRTIQSFADTIRKRVRGRQPQALLAHLHDFLFDEKGFIGETSDYYNPVNSYVPVVLETKRGLPITLSLIYKCVGERLGLRVHGIGLPGHFLVAVEFPDSAMLVDPFSGGRLLSMNEALSRVKDALGPQAEWNDELLRPVSNLHWLTRMLQNLLHAFGADGRYADVAAVLEMEMILWPQQKHLQRDLALVLARIGMSKPASIWLNRYLQSNPQDPQRNDLQQLLEVLSM